MAEIKDKDKYLQEDQDLIGLIDGERKAPNPWDQQRINIRATLRARKTFKEFSEATNRFSLVLIIIGLIQICVAVLQYSLSVQVLDDKQTQVVAIVALVVLFLTLWWNFRKVLKPLQSEEE